MKNEITLNKYEFCWRCGIDFNPEVLMERKTYHHSIPKLFKPKYNIKIPVCQECHYAINPINEKIILAFLKRLKKSTDNFLSKYKAPAKNIIISDDLKKLIK